LLQVGRFVRWEKHYTILKSTPYQQRALPCLLPAACCLLPAACAVPIKGSSVAVHLGTKVQLGDVDGANGKHSHLPHLLQVVGEPLVLILTPFRVNHACKSNIATDIS